MTTDRLPFFLALARNWRAAADALRAAGVPDDDPAVRVWREAAWCHVLFVREVYHAALASLRAVVRAVTGESPCVILSPVTEVAAVTAATDLFDLLHATVSARHPRAFDRPAAA
jgi:hypothetical protein